MFLRILLYNLLMIGVDLGVLVRLRNGMTWWHWLASMGVAAVAAAGLAVAAVGGSPFAIMHLAAYGLFLHGPVLLVGSAQYLWASHRRLAISCGLAALLLLGVAVDAFLIEPTWLEVTRHRIETSKIDEPIRIVVLADLQTDRIGPYERCVVKEVLRQQPDLILLAGDYLHAYADEQPRLRRELSALLHDVHFRAPLGVYAVEGNIDSAGWTDAFDGLPVTVARRTETFSVGPIDLTCLSLVDSGFPGLTLPRPDVERFHIALGHRPDFARGEVEADLLLAGHTHGGQVRLPLVGPLLTLSSVPRSWAAGLTELSGGRRLIVSRGIGHERRTAPRLRFLCRPELVVIDLVPDEGGDGVARG